MQKVAVTGENGGGKPTLMKILCGLLKNDTGTLRLNREGSHLLTRRRIRFNLRLGRLTAKGSEIDELSAKLGITPLCDRGITGGDELSGGEKQKISIARAVLKDTNLFFLDEPSNHLDADTRYWLADCISESKKTVVYILHDVKRSDRLLHDAPPALLPERTQSLGLCVLSVRRGGGLYVS